MSADLKPALLLPDKPEPRLNCGRFALGDARIDATLGGGLARGRLHEVYTASADQASAAGFVAGLACRLDRERPLLWIRRAGVSAGQLYGAGLVALGLDPARLIFVHARDALGLLRAGVEATRCAGLVAVVIELHGRVPHYDLTTSRRLVLAAERSGVTPLLLAVGTEPVPSAAETRWRVTAAPSQRLAANAPGGPAFELDLLRQRAGPSGLNWRVEWDCDEHDFRETALSGAVVPISQYRAAA